MLSNASPPALTGSGAFPGADIAGTIGAQPCAGVADGAGLLVEGSPVLDAELLGGHHLARGRLHEGRAAEERDGIAGLLVKLLGD